MVKNPASSIVSQKTAAAATKNLTQEAKLVAKREPVENVAPTPREHVAYREINRAIDNIPKDDPRREMTAAAHVVPVSTAPPVTPQWDGAYVGLNVGANAGTNSNVYSQNYNNQSQEKTQLGNLVQANSTVGNTVSGNASNNQSGFVGGAQLGYNYLTGRVLFGGEVDLQGSNTRGTSLISGNTTDQTSSSIPITLPSPFNVSLNLPGVYTGIGSGTNSIQGGVDYIGTVRGRIGYVAKPELLVYGTAGLAYGGAWANVTQLAAYDCNESVASFSSAAGAPVLFNGGGRQNKLLVGWTAGTGAEWMFSPNWSLKGEALYWDLGNMNVNTNARASEGSGQIWGHTSVNYSGIMARAGLNYHINLAAAPIATKY